MESISDPRAMDLFLYAASLPHRDRLAVMEAMRDVFPQLKHDRKWSGECEQLWREVGDGRLDGETPRPARWKPSPLPRSSATN
jgi:hypothetical protein